MTDKKPSIYELDKAVALVEQKIENIQEKADDRKEEIVEIKKDLKIILESIKEIREILAGYKTAGNFGWRAWLVVIGVISIMGGILKIISIVIKGS